MRFLVAASVLVIATCAERSTPLGDAGIVDGGDGVIDASGLPCEWCRAGVVGDPAIMARGCVPVCLTDMGGARTRCFAHAEDCTAMCRIRHDTAGMEACAPYVWASDGG